ncbi:MAG: hypothetical protein K6D37_02265 [Prevotella sp.]|jgi:hypothetical protein|nr:hypothetical protein [Prevotella sp.]
MRATDQTIQQIERALLKTASRFPATEEASVMTDIHVRVTQESGELMTFDDDDNELMRCVVEQWIDNKDDDFYDHVAECIKKSILKQKDVLENMSIIKPYSFVLEDDDCDTLKELYVVDDDIAIIDPLSLESFDSDLDDFIDKLLKS